MLTTKSLGLKKKITAFFSTCPSDSNQDSNLRVLSRKSLETSEILTLTVSSSLTPSGIPNMAKISNTIVESSQTNVVQSYCKPKFCKFLMKHCLRLITEDVMCNKAFIECLSCSVENIMSHEKQKGIYKDKIKRRKPTTELSKN